ncbi:DUF6188 family protein [Kitasatospora sp. NPDC015120]|uniref:DUF6188 family protein n=1 Tax=Kitasatospora sp. NPDC015120 TaxID=3364023 RepID=UPI0036F4696A
MAEHEDRWIMNLRGQAVTRISIDYKLTLLLDSDARVVLGCPFELTQSAKGTREPVVLDPGRQDVVAALGLFGAKVLSAVAFKTGSMRLVFDNGCHLNSRAHPDFEAWEVLGPGGWRIIARPGGGLAVWSGQGLAQNDQTPAAGSW